jgi:uncharacterized protein (DUF1499 family)
MSLLSGKKPAYLGHKLGQLAALPKSPNCVSSQVSGKANINPLTFTGSASSAWVSLKSVMSADQNASQTEIDDSYMHIECKTPLLGFVDDLEFYLDEPNEIIHVRSASRLGYSDLGKNRQRVEHIRTAFNKRESQQ